MDAGSSVALVCPACRGEIDLGVDRMACRQCREVYEYRGGFPDLIVGGRFADDDDEARTKYEEESNAYLARNYRPTLSHQWILVMVAAAAVAAALIAVVRPRWQDALVGILAVTAFIFLIFRPLAMPWTLWLSTLPLSPTQQYWAFGIRALRRLRQVS